MALKTIDEHNTEMQEIRKVTEMSGIACPSCGLELKWTHVAYMSSPPQPQRGVKCICGWSGSVS